MPTIKDVEGQISQHPKIREALRELGLFSDRYRPTVRLCGQKRDKRRSADFKNWSPEADFIRIEFESADAVAEADERDEIFGGNPETPSDPAIDLICALARAESRGFDFVSLKWFRDTALPTEGFPWGVDETSRQTVLRDAIERRLILTHKVPNPKSPRFPVTAIRLNRLAPEVKAALGRSTAEVFDHRPVTIRGEALSATVLRDRR